MNDMQENYLDFVVEVLKMDSERVLATDEQLKAGTYLVLEDDQCAISFLLEAAMRIWDN